MILLAYLGLWKYIGSRLHSTPQQVTMDNLNDNINLEFLSNKLQKFGEWDSLVIDYHPVTKKHLGLARVMFKLVGSAVACVAALHGRSMMGKQVGD